MGANLLSTCQSPATESSPPPQSPEPPPVASHLKGKQLPDSSISFSKLINGDQKGLKKHHRIQYVLSKSKVGILVSSA